MATVHHQIKPTSSYAESGSQKFCHKPCQTALSKVRRNLFGSVDHSESLSLAEQELKVQSILDSERWGFDFHLELPINSTRFEWQPFDEKDFVPKFYALRSMKYLGSNASTAASSKDPLKKQLLKMNNKNKINNSNKLKFLCIEKAKFGHTSKINLNSCTKSKNCSQVQSKEQTSFKKLVPKKQCVITDFMKKRKKPQNIYVKNVSKPLGNVPQTSDSRNMRT